METVFTVQNIRCSGCEQTITKKLSAIPGVSRLHVNTAEGTLGFTYTHDEVVSQVKQRLKALGYPPADEENSLTSKMKSVVSCAKGKLR
ncbi:MAG TPA: heavy metal-associated domain-containing protein [Flavobacteriaceae bacterium]|nr:heavy metal-associated domain-containing protein [Flavobacteriaceae bacterium]